MSASLSFSLALSMAAGPSETTPGKSSARLSPNTMNRSQARPKEVSIYKGISDRPLGWKAKGPASSSLARDIMMKFDGAGRKSTEWVGLRRDPELWLPNGDCLVHLYDYGRSKRGPAFKVPLSGIRAANCQSLLDRFMVTVDHPPTSESISTTGVGGSDRSMAKQYELYIPTPALLEREQAFLYHTATRNLFAWMFGKSLVGKHVGGALVGLLNSMNEFRDPGHDNIQAIMNYMDKEGYGDMRNQPDHALGILFFAENFQFRDLWMDAFAHCVGMNDQLATSPGHEFISNPSRSLIARSRIEMDIRLESCGRRLGTFLSDDSFGSGLSARARAHLDTFRSFLQSYFVGKFGYYPPSTAQNPAFPKNAYNQMCSEFEKLYEFLVDDHFTPSESLPLAHSGGICVEKVVETFDNYHKYEGLLHPLPLLPETVEPIKPKRSRFGFQSKEDKMKPNPRLLTFAALSRAANRKEHLLGCSFVRAYQGFERECVFSSTSLFVDKDEKLSQKEARKVRWILIYSILQTLLSVTRIPDQVTDIHDVPYNLCVLTTDPPWKEQKPDETVEQTQTDPIKVNSASAATETEAKTVPFSTSEIKPDTDSSSTLLQRSQQTEVPIPAPLENRGSVKKARRALEDMPEFRHKVSKSAASYREILVQGYGNGTNMVNIAVGSMPTSQKGNSHARKLSSESGNSSIEDSSFRWSNMSMDAIDDSSPSTSVAAESIRCSRISMETSKGDFKTCLDEDSGFFDLERVPDSLWMEAVDESCAWVPESLEIKKLPLEQQFMQITTEVKVKWEKPKKEVGPADLMDYLHNPNPCPMVVIHS